MSALLGPVSTLADSEIIALLQQIERDRARLDALHIQALSRLHQLRQGKRHTHGKYVGDEMAAVVQDWSSDRTVAAVRAKLSREVHKIDPHGAEARKRERVKSRRVSYQPQPDGTAVLSIYDTAERVRAFYQLLDQLARAAQQAGDPRSLDALRADAWMDLVLGPNWERVKTELRITVPSSVLAGLSHHPAQLHGYGPITTNTMLALANQHAFWRRIITDPATGTVLEVSRRQPPGSLREYLNTPHPHLRRGRLQPARRVLPRRPHPRSRQRWPDRGGQPRPRLRAPQPHEMGGRLAPGAARTRALRLDLTDLADL